MVLFATLPLVDKCRLRSQREPSPWLLSIWIQKSPAARSSSSPSSCAWSATSPPSRLVRFLACRVTNALRIKSVLTPAGHRHTIAPTPNHLLEARTPPAHPAGGAPSGERG